VRQRQFEQFGPERHAERGRQSRPAGWRAKWQFSLSHELVLLGRGADLQLLDVQLFDLRQAD
jgi:hypothetical protein